MNGSSLLCMIFFCYHRSSFTLYCSFYLMILLFLAMLLGLHRLFSVSLISLFSHFSYNFQTIQTTFFTHLSSSLSRWWCGDAFMQRTSLRKLEWGKKLLSFRSLFGNGELLMFHTKKTYSFVFRSIYNFFSFHPFFRRRLETWNLLSSPLFASIHE
jgi:hypothetical protein